MLLSWTNVSNIATGYQIQQSTGGSDYSTIATVWKWSTSYEVDGLMGDTAYSFRVCAIDDAGVSAYVAAACATESNISGTLDANDDYSSAAIDLGMDLNFYGKWFSQVYLNNNGNLTISGPMSTYSPDTPFATINNTIIAPFFADVNTRDGYGSVVYGPAIVDGHTAWVANWDDVGYYTVTATEDGDQPDLRDSFGVTLIDRSDVQRPAI